jgi:hypothetical protein
VAAEFAGVTPGAPARVYRPATPLDPDEPLMIDPRAARLLFVDGGLTLYPPPSRPPGPPSYLASRGLLQVLLEARDEDGRPLTDAEIGDEVATFLLAGHRRPASVGTV